MTMPSDIERYLEHSEAYPYDDRQGGDWAVRAARGILANLCDRRGIKQALRDEDIDDGIKAEIVDDLAATIRLCAP